MTPGIQTTLQWLCAAFGPTTWANWAAAIGTLGAVWTALYIAGQTRTRQEAEDRLKAELAASKLAPLIDRDIRLLRPATLAFGLPHGMEGPTDAERAAIVMAALRRTNLAVESTDVIALVPLGENCAFRLARAYSLLRRTLTEMEGSSALVTFLRSEWDEAINEADDLLTKAAATCAKHGHVDRFDETDLP